MIRHRIIWKLKDTLDEHEKVMVKANAKKSLESLYGEIDGLLEIKVITEMLPTSTGDMMLDSLFTSSEALQAYAVHPKHVHAANTFVRPFTQSRACVDYET